jgi:hypothetical protein
VSQRLESRAKRAARLQRSRALRRQLALAALQAGARPTISKRAQRIAAGTDRWHSIETHKDGEKHVVIRGRLDSRVFQRNKYARV